MQTTQNKVYALFGKSGMMEEIKPVDNLPMYCKIYTFGMGMSGREGAIISENKGGYYEAVYISDYQQGFFRVDKYARPLSAKFGIGRYYSDELETFEQSEVLKYIELAKLADIKRSKDEQDKKDADKKEIELLPSLYPFLTPLKSETFETYKERKRAAKNNLIAYLKHEFPGIKFSVKNDHDSTYNVSWVNGPTRSKVDIICDKFEDHHNDHSGDYRDYNPSNFNHVFGGFKFVFAERNFSEDVENLRNTLKEMLPNRQDYEIGNTFFKLMNNTDIPQNATNFQIERTDLTCGSIEDFFKIIFDVPSNTQQAKQSDPLIIGNIQIIDYSDKAIAVIGETKPIKDQLKAMGGRFNFRLTCGIGWIFPKAKQSEVNNFLTSLNLI